METQRHREKIAADLNPFAYHSIAFGMDGFQAYRMEAGKRFAGEEHSDVIIGEAAFGTVLLEKNGFHFPQRIFEESSVPLCDKRSQAPGSV